jgi:hypothetical protein
MINIKGLDKGAVLAALYNNANVQGMGIFQATPGNMTAEEGAKLLERETYFDYLYGRVMKIRVEGDEIDPRLYDRDNGNGAALRAIETIL